MKLYMKLLLLLLLTLIFAAGCDDGDKPKTTKKTLMDISKASSFFVATDAEGWINFFMIDDAGKVVELTDRAIQYTPPNASAVLTNYGEVQVSHKHEKIIVIIQQNADSLGNGGLLVLDPHEVISENIQRNIKIFPLPSTLTVNNKAGSTTNETVTGITRLVHSFLDPDGNHIWVNNDGKSGDSNPDSAFKVNIAGLADGKLDAADFIEVLVGHGHKKSAFITPTTANSALPNLFITHSGNGTYHAIDNKLLLPGQSVPNPIKQVVDSTDVGVSPSTSAVREAFHGMASSLLDGRVYVGSTKAYIDDPTTRSSPHAISILDTAKPFDVEIGYPVIKIARGTGYLTDVAEGVAETDRRQQIPAAGYMKASHDGSRIYSYGWSHTNTDKTEAAGYLSILNSSVASTSTTTTPSDSKITGIVKLKNLSTSSFDIVEHSHGGANTIYIFAPGQRKCSTSSTPLSTAEKNSAHNEIAVIPLDANGDFTGDTTAIKYISVGPGPCHRNGEVSEDSRWVIYPDGCPAVGDQAHDPACSVNTVNVIDAHNHDFPVVKVKTKGVNPSNLNFVGKTLILKTAAQTGGHAHP